MFIRNSILFLFFTTISVPIFSQRLITGRVLDINTKSTVDQVDVSIYKGTGTATSNKNGYFQLTVKEGDSLLIMHPEYKIGLIAVPASDVFTVYIGKVDDYPVYLPGKAKMYNYLKQNLKYSPGTRSKRKEGVLFVQLLIRANGEIEDCLLLNEFNKKYEQNALEVFKNIPGSWSASHSTKSFIFPLIYRFNHSTTAIDWPLVDLPEAKIMERIIVLAEDF